MRAPSAEPAKTQKVPDLDYTFGLSPGLLNFHNKWISQVVL